MCEPSRPTAVGVPTSIAPLTERPSWAALRAHVEEVRGLHLRDLFAAHPRRGERLVAEGAGLHLD